jgi:hypothetical protein
LKDRTMSRDYNQYEIHVHGDVPVKPGISYKQVEEALKPLWKYAGAKSLGDAPSLFEEEPGIGYDAQKRVLSLCWTVEGNADFQNSLDEACGGINELSAEGAGIEVSYYDNDDEEGRDEFGLIFVGPTPEAIHETQRQYMQEDVTRLLERHFDRGEMAEVVDAVNRLFAKRLLSIAQGQKLSRFELPSNGGSGHGGGNGGHNKRHLH